MSIANIVIEFNRALIGVDTLAGYMSVADQHMSQDERRDRHSGKLSLFPQFSSAMTHRGDGLLTSLVRLNLEGACPHDFDEAVKMMPGILAQAYTQAMAHRKQHLGIDSFPGAEVVLVGWSPSRRLFNAVRWIRRPDAPEFTSEPVIRMLVTPEIDRVERVELPDTDARMEALVRRQMEWARTEHPDFPSCGGRLLMAELTRDAVTVRTIANLERPSVALQALED